MKFIGRILSRRVQGSNLSFIDIQQEEKIIQIVLDSKNFISSSLPIPPLSRSDIIEVECVLSSSSNQYCATFLKILNSFHNSSLLPSVKTNILPEIKHRKRYLDLIINSSSVITRFKQRSKIISKIRSFLEERNFLEVETPILQTKPNGANARPFKILTTNKKDSLSLRISPELPLKTLLVGGIEKVFEIGKVFRNESSDPTHNPEFTSLELYQSMGTLADMKKLLIDILLMLSFIKENTTTATINSFNVMDQLYLLYPSLRVDYQTHHLLNILKGESLEKERLQDSSYLWDRLISLKVEAPLSKKYNFFFLHNHPLIMSPLAKGLEKGEGEGFTIEVADRFELFINGIEIANAYVELTDPLEQEKRFLSQQSNINNEEYIDALKIGLPPCSGMGIGIDRLVMVILGLDSIKDVILYPFLKEKCLK